MSKTENCATLGPLVYKFTKLVPKNRKDFPVTSFVSNLNAKANQRSKNTCNSERKKKIKSRYKKIFSSPSLRKSSRIEESLPLNAH